jgi:hypothetical protein
LKEGEYMAHEHIVNDGDKHFSIDPVTRKITNESGKFVLIQRDHNSERFTFSIPKTVDGHDMSLCNSVKVHYLNVELAEVVKEEEEEDTKKTNKKEETEPEIVYEPTGTVYEGLYESDDIKVSPDDEEKVICSWLISRNATQYFGELNFVVRFACVSDDGTEEYGWSTDICTGIKITTGIFNTDVIVEEYPDILEKWRQELILPNIAENLTPEQVRGAMGAATRLHMTATIGTSWNGTAAPYTQTIGVEGIEETDTPHISPVYSDTLSTAILESNAWSRVSMAESAQNAIVFTCFKDKPETAIPIQIEVVR